MNSEEHDVSMTELRRQIANLRQTQARIADLNAMLRQQQAARAREIELAEEKRRNSWWYQLGRIVIDAFTFRRSDK